MLTSFLNKIFSLCLTKIRNVKLKTILFLGQRIRTSVGAWKSNYDMCNQPFGWVCALLTRAIINYWSSLQLEQSHKLSLSAKHSKLEIQDLPEPDKSAVYLFLSSQSKIFIVDNKVILIKLLRYQAMNNIMMMLKMNMKWQFYTIHGSWIYVLTLSFSVCKRCQ